MQKLSGILFCALELSEVHFILGVLEIGFESVIKGANDNQVAMAAKAILAIQEPLVKLEKELEEAARRKSTATG